MALRTLMTSTLIVLLLYFAPGAKAHCDSVDGPVAQAVQKALETGNIYPVLAYAPASAESEILTAFEQARRVRVLGAEARALADKSFLETAIRLHRAGEGAAYTGLRSAGQNYGPVIPAAELAIAAGDLSTLETVLIEQIHHGLEERLTHLRELQSAPLEPKMEADVPRSRARIRAELGFITFAESLRQAALGKGIEHHVD